MLDCLFAPVIALVAANAIACYVLSDHSYLTMAPDVRYIAQIHEVYASADVVLAFGIFAAVGSVGTYLVMRITDRRRIPRLRTLLLASTILTFILLLPDLLAPSANV